MKIWVRVILSIMLAVFMAIGMIGCTQGEVQKPSEGGNITEDNNTSEEDMSQGQDEDKVQEGKNEENKNGESSEVDGKLVPDPPVAVREGMDYITVDVPAEDFELEDLEGNVVRLSDYEGQIVFLNFWATWCPPCRVEMPHMQEIYEEYGDRGIVILAVCSTQLELRGGTNSDKAKQQVEQFIKDNGYTFPVLLDRDDEVALKYNNIYPITGIPVNFMIDKEGQIRYARPGAFSGKEQMEAFIALLEE